MKLFLLATTAFVIWLTLGARAATPTVTPNTEKERASWECQRAAMHAAGGHVLPAAACYCRAKVGLPEAPTCKADRTGRKGQR